MVWDLSYPGRNRPRFVALLVTALISAALPAFSTALGDEGGAEQPEGATISAVEKEGSRIVREAIELLASGEREAAQKLIDDLKASWEEGENLDEDAEERMKKRFLDLEWCLAHTPTEVATYVAAVDRVNDASEQVRRMGARLLAHAPVLDELEKTLHDDVALIRRLRGVEKEDNPKIVFDLGLIHACRCEWKLAEESLERSHNLYVDQHPDNGRQIAVVEQWLAWILMMEQEDFARQKAYLESTIAFAEAHQDNEESRYWPERAGTLLAEATYRHGDHGEATRLFREVRRKLPEDPKPCGPDGCKGTCYVQWCQMWCDRHDARRLNAEGRYEEAIAAIDRATELLAAGGAQRDLNAAVTAQELACLKAEARCGQGRYREADDCMVVADAFAKHSADLADVPHVPLKLDWQKDLPADVLTYRTRSVRTVYTSQRRETILFIEAEGHAGTKFLSELEHGANYLFLQGDYANHDAYGCDMARSMTRNLGAGNISAALRAAISLRQSLLANCEPDHPRVKLIARWEDLLFSLEDWTGEEQHEFAKLYFLVFFKSSPSKIENRACPPFAHVDAMIENLIRASEQVAAMPEPACRLQCECKARLAELHVVRREWAKAQLLLESVCSAPEEDRGFTRNTENVYQTLAFVLAEQGKD